MSLHSDIDFRNSSDTGEPESAAIVPFTNGEPANQTVFRRPTENNRSRTDILRTLLRELIILGDLDREGPAVYGGGTVTFNGAKGTYTGQFTLSADLMVVPFATPGGNTFEPYLAATKAALSVGTPSTDELVFTSKYRQWEKTGADPDIAKDANRISVEIQDTGSVSVSVVGATGEENNILITIDLGVTTCQNVIDAVVASVPASELVTVALGAGTLGSAFSPKFSEAEWGTDFSARFLRGGAASTSHIVNNTQLAAFFAAHAENSLEKGDTLAIWYDKLVELSTDGGRFQSMVENLNNTIPAAALFNTRREPAKIPGCVPICKCVDDDTLVFANGAAITRTQPATLWNDSYALTGSELGVLATPLGWSRMDVGTVHSPPVTVREALNNADGHIDNILNEIEAARTSAVFGAAANMDARLDAMDGHLERPMVISDNVLSTGGRFNDPTALMSALGMLNAARGGTILLKAGTYHLTTNFTLTKKINIIAIEDNVILENRQASTPLTFSGTGAEGSSLVGLEIVKGTGGGNLAFEVSTGACRFIDLRVEGRVTVNGGIGTEFIGGHYKSVAADIRTIVLSNPAVDTVFKGLTVWSQNATTGAIIFLSSGDIRTHVSHCTFLPGDHQGVIVTGTLSRFTMEHCHFDLTVGPTNVADRPALRVTDGYAKLKHLTFAASTTSWALVSSVIDLQGHEIYADDILIDLNNNILDFTLDNEPVRFIGTGTLSRLNFSKCYIPDDTNWSPAPVLNADIPIVRVEGVINETGSWLGIATLRDSRIHDIKNLVAAGGNSPVLVLGGYSSTGLAVANQNGSQHFLNNFIDVRGLNFEIGLAGGPRNAITHIQPGSVIDDNEIYVGASQYGFPAIQVNEAGDPAVKVRRNVCDHTAYAKSGAVSLTYRHETVNCKFGGEVIGNTCRIAGGEAFVTTDVLFVGHAGFAATTRAMRIENNTVINTTGTAAVGAVRLMQIINVVSGTVIGNVLDANGSGMFRFVDGGGNTTIPAAASFATMNHELA
jgi:hypothetical protein